MSKREELKQKFINKYLPKSVRYPLQPDASKRTYERLIFNNNQYILMDCPPDYQKLDPFIKIDEYLLKIGLCAPKIYHKDKKNGFLILEDFGDFSFTNILSSEIPLVCENQLYKLAIEVLAQLNNSKILKNLPLYDNKLLLKEVKLLTDWFLPKNCDDDLRLDFLNIWSDILENLKIQTKTVVLRDYHADNLIYIGDNIGINKIGLLDFQDAVIGSNIYDLVSLLEDARRDVCNEVVDNMINYYLSLTNNISKDEFLSIYNILAAQRNCKIIGIFARLSQRDLKPHYLNYIPRVWKNLKQDLQHPDLKNLLNWFNKIFNKKNNFDDVLSQKKIIL